LAVIPQRSISYGDSNFPCDIYFETNILSLEINKVHQGNCLELMKNIDAGSVDMILTDLPYNVTECVWDNLIPFPDLWKQYNRILKPNGVVVLTASGKFTIQTINSNLKYYRYSWIWQKNNCTNFANAKVQPLRNTEDVLVFYKKQPTYNPQGVKPLKRLRDRTKDKIGESYEKPSLKTAYYQTNTNYPKTILKFDRDKTTFHNTAKPVALFEYLIRTYTNEGETVLDSCCGGGSTAVACLNSNRNFIVMDIETRYCNITNKRIHDWYSTTTKQD
jgi:site-specific DNA-methyltransferase (adenine-specific)